MSLTNLVALTGACLCGSVRFAIAPGGVFDAGWCHCRQCRHMTGTAALAFTNVAPASFSVTDGAPKRFPSSALGSRVFCGDCGSPLFFAPVDDTTHVGVNVGCLDHPEDPSVRPRFHMFDTERLCWFDADPVAPRFADNQLSHPDARPPAVALEPDKDAGDDPDFAPRVTNFGVSKQEAAMPIREPWIGAKFSGLLIIGESHYGTDEQADDVELTRRVIAEIVSGKRHRFHTKVRRLVDGDESGEDAASFWPKVAFLNFCPGLTEGARHRPDGDMWSVGHAALPGLLRKIAPTHILVLGAETWMNMPPFETPAEPLLHHGGMRDAGYYLVSDDRVALATSVPHPSGWGLSAGRWDSFVAAFLHTPIET